MLQNNAAEKPYVINAEFSIFYRSLCARLNDLYKAALSQLEINIPALFHQQMFSTMLFNNFDITYCYS